MQRFDVSPALHLVAIARSLLLGASEHDDDIDYV